MSDKKTVLLEKIKEKKWLGKDQFIIFILVGVLLLIIAMPTEKKLEKNMMKSEQSNNSSDIIETEGTGIQEEVKELKAAGSSAEEYEAYMEHKLEQAIREMEGAGDVKVVVAVQSSKEQIVEKDIPVARTSVQETDSAGGSRNTEETDSGEETVYIKQSDGSTKPYVVKTLQPEIQGIIVIAKGGGNTGVKKNITEAIMALFNIEQHKIKVVKMKSE